MIFYSKFTKTITSSALLAGVASSSFVSAYDMKLRRGISCDEDDISSNGSKLEALTKKDVTNVDDENLFKDDELDGYKDNRRVRKDNVSHGSSYEDTDSVDKVPIVNKREAEISKLKDNKSSSESDLLKILDFKTVASIISASSSIGILGGLAKKLFSDKKVNPTKSDGPEPYIQDDNKNKDNPDPNEKEKKKDGPGPSPVAPGNGNSNKKYIVNPTKPDDPEPHIKDDDKNKDNPDPNEKEKKKDEPVTPASENSNKKYILIALGFFGFVVLAVILFNMRKILFPTEKEYDLEKLKFSEDDLDEYLKNKSKQTN